MGGTIDMCVGRGHIIKNVDKEREKKKQESSTKANVRKRRNKG